MMQIYLDAISQSRAGDTQYVLQRSLYMERTSSKETVVKRLNDGWDLRGEFHNGVGYEKYTVRNANDIETLFSFVESNTGISLPKHTCFLVYMSFQEFYDQFCKSESINLDVDVWLNGRNIPESIHFVEDQAHVIRDFATNILHIRQDKEWLIRCLSGRLNPAHLIKKGNE